MQAAAPDLLPINWAMWYERSAGGEAASGTHITI
jgi:hypothetical protein